MRETFVEVPKMAIWGPVLKGGSRLFQDWGTGLGHSGLGHASHEAGLRSPLGPLHATSPPSPPCPCALQSSHSTVPQDSCGTPQATSVPDTCPVMSPAVQWPSLLTSFWGSGPLSQIANGKVQRQEHF